MYLPETGTARIWEWQAGMERAVAPHACQVDLLAPLPLPSSSPLPQTPACTRLRSLTIHHIHAAALPALSALVRLQSLDAHGGLSCLLAGSRLSLCVDVLPLNTTLVALLPSHQLQHKLMLLVPCNAPSCCSHAVFFPDEDPQWLQWAAGLSLKELRLTAAPLRLQPEEGLAALLPHRRLAALRLDG